MRNVSGRVRGWWQSVMNDSVDCVTEKNVFSVFHGTINHQHWRLVGQVSRTDGQA